MSKLSHDTINVDIPLKQYRRKIRNLLFKSNLI